MADVENLIEMARVNGRGDEHPIAVAIDAIIIDLADRRGLGQEWDQIDGDIKDEIIATWEDILKELLVPKRD